MSQFSQCLQDVMGGTRGWQKKLAMEAGVNAANVSRWRKGQSLPDREVLARLVGKLTREEGARLAVAWVRDQLPVNARELVTVTERDPSSRVTVEPDQWPEDLGVSNRRMFVNFARIATRYPDVMDIVEVVHQAAARLTAGK